MILYIKFYFKFSWIWTTKSIAASAHRYMKCMLLASSFKCWVLYSPVIGVYRVGKGDHLGERNKTIPTEESLMFSSVKYLLDTTKTRSTWFNKFLTTNRKKSPLELSILFKINKDWLYMKMLAESLDCLLRVKLLMATLLFGKYGFWEFLS